MKVIIVGSGRVGSSIALRLAARDCEIAVIDADPDAFARLGDDFPAELYVGHALDSEIFERANIESADAFIACTNDDNTNIVIAQIARRRYGVSRVVVRVFDPAKAEFYSKKGLRIVCPTLRSIDEMTNAVGGDEADDATASDVVDVLEART